jgi:CheY-like chemotaxis protein
VAKIIHVEDEPQWVDVVRRALADHEVDSARTWEQALALLRGPVVYDIALIDLSGGADKEGEELLDLLRVDFPATRRVVITAFPPPGDLRSRIYDRYGVEDIIIKDKTTLPDLQLVVRRALRREANEVPAAVNLEATALREDFRDWQATTQDEIRREVREAITSALHAGRSPGGVQAEGAEAVRGDWQSLQHQLGTECGRIDALIAAAQTSAEVSAAARELAQLKDHIAAEMRRLRGASGQR